MDLKEIMAISGQSGLYKFVSQGRNGIIVESFADKKRSFVSAATKVSSLEDIAIFTDKEEVPLKEILKTIFELEKGGAAIDPKSSPDELKKYMEKVLPNYDHDRVYISDIKKLVLWYNTLHNNNLLSFENEPEKTGEDVKNDKPKATKEVKADSLPEKTKPKKKTTTSASHKKSTVKKTRITSRTGSK
jgi:hypothetical protein